MFSVCVMVFQCGSTMVKIPLPQYRCRFNLKFYERHLFKPKQTYIDFQFKALYMTFCYIKILYSVLVSVSCPKALYQLESDNLFRITVVVADWLR